MNRLFPTLALTIGLAVPATTRADDLTAANDTLSLRYDDVSHAFSVMDKATGNNFLLNGKLNGTNTKASENTATDPVFGRGQSVVVTQADGSTVNLTVYQTLPFLLVTKEQRNNSPAEIDLQTTVPASFAIDLGKPANQLVTMGTGGLLPAAKNPGSYFFLTAADPATRNGVVTGWLTQDLGSGTVFSGTKDGKVEFKAQLEHGHLFLQPHDSVKLDTFAIGYFTDARRGQEQFADAVRKQYDIHLRPPLATYCSWYAEGPGHGRAGTPATTVELSRFIAKELKPFGLGVIQIDDGWQDGPQIDGPATEFDRVAQNLAYRDGIAPVAAELAKDGVTFGLWWLPFGRNHLQPQYKDHQDWFVKNTDGSPLRQHSFGGTCLDCTHPEVQEHLKNLAQTIRSWGVKYYKMDGISVGAGLDHVYINDGYKDDHFGQCLPLHDRSKTNIEAMRLGLQTIRQGAGDDVFFSGCCAVQNMRTYAGSIGLVESMRVGPDFNHDGEGIRSGPLRGSRMYFMNGRIWWNDPDPTKVRTSNEGCEGDPSINGGVTLEQARLTSSWVSLTGQFFLVSDWLPNLPQERLEVLRRTLAHHNATARPVDYFDHALANTWLVTDSKSDVRRDVIGLFNFYESPLSVDHPCAKLGLDPAKSYHAFDFWANTPLADFQGDFKSYVDPNACRVIAVRAAEGRPVVISTSRHVTQGMIDLSSEKWSDPAAMLSARSALVANDPCELRIAGTSDGGKLWKPINVTLSPGDQAAGVTASSVECPGLLRVTLRSPVTRTVSWSVSFAKKPLPLSSLTNLKAGMADAESPVSLTWDGTAPFHDISRDGIVIAANHYGFSFADPGAPAGQAVVYSVKITGTEIAATTMLTTKTLDPGPPPPLPVVSLPELAPHAVTVKVGWGAMTVGKDVGGGPLVLAGTTYQSGIGLHANAEATFSVPPSYRRFVAIVGLDDSQRKDPRASIRCSVVAENAAGQQTDLAKSPTLRSGKLAQWHFDLPLPAGCKNLHLIVSDAGDGIACDHADWVNAGFIP